MIQAQCYKLAPEGQPYSQTVKACQGQTRQLITSNRKLGM